MHWPQLSLASPLGMSPELHSPQPSSALDDQTRTQATATFRTLRMIQTVVRWTVLRK